MEDGRRRDIMASRRLRQLVSWVMRGKASIKDSVDSTTTEQVNDVGGWERGIKQPR